MMLNNWLLVAFPVAVSQLTVFWMILTRRFQPDLPTECVELVTPLLGAFLGAHVLSAEYRSRVGALLACRPVNIGRIVIIRLVVVLAVVWALAIISLLAFAGMSPYDMTTPFLACVASTLFLTMLALTFATLFRHSLAGFAIAAVYWIMDILPGPPIQPYMSLRTLTSYYRVFAYPDQQTFVREWWISKLLLLAGAAVLYLVHARIVFTLGSAQTNRIRRMAMASAVVLVAFYLASGALIRVGYGYANRGRLTPNDVAWFRREFAPYGPIPVASLFGRDFARYVGDTGNPWRTPEGEDADVMGDTDKHRRELYDVVMHSPHSPWAPSAADALARITSRKQSGPEKAAAQYKIIIDRYPNSPYVEFAMRQAARVYVDGGRPAEAQAMYSELAKRSPHGEYASEALRYLVESAQFERRWDDAARWAQQWTESAPIEDRFDAWVVLAQSRKASGDAAGAKQAAQSAIAAVKDFRKAMAAGTLGIGPTRVNLRQRAADVAEASAQSLL
ncbi:MAG TPA: hypothetical protein VKT77_19645 [Chthonomonadaceae bacterium]|nr:hypothetical protein [Chthonomonadaceae bacterium]